MVDHFQIVQELSAESHRILLAIHESITEKDKHASRRELRDNARVLSFKTLDREVDHLISQNLLTRTSPKEARNLRLTPLGRGVVAQLLAPKQLSII